MSTSSPSALGTLAVDVAVIGAGTAGLAAYRAAAARTPRVVVIEAGPHGTTCARVGCMPSKLLIAAADAAHHARHAAPFGVRATVEVAGRAVMDRVRAERDRFVGFVTAGVDAIPESHKLHGRARFVAPGVLEVNGTRVEARAVVVATGSSPVVPPMFAQVPRERLVVNDDVFAWTELPRSVAVFGAGVIGLELGQALHRLGVRVRVFGRGGGVGPLSDPAVRAVAEATLRAELPLDPDARVRHVRADDADGVTVEFDDEHGAARAESFEYVLAAAGRRPNLAGLGLEHAGVALDARGAPAYDPATLQCGATGVFVAGDAALDLPLLHEAADEGRIAGDNAARYPAAAVPGARRTPLAIAFTDPQIAIVGPGYAALVRERGADAVVTGEVSFADQGRSRVMLQNRGLLRVYAEPSTGRFLGAEMAGPRAEHIGHLLAWAHQQGLTVDAMLAMPFYHPVIEEGVRTALRDASAKLAARRR